MTDRTVEISVVVPVFDEEANLEPLDGEIRTHLEALGRPAEIIYVDDGSRDGSLAVLRQLLLRAPSDLLATRVVKLRRHFGQTAAIAAGFDLARGEIVLPLDADGQNNPRDVPRLVARLEEGFDVVSGWRRRRRDRALSRTLPSRVANWLAGRLTGVRLHDLGCTLKAYRGSLVKEVRLYGDMHRFIPLYLARIGARVTELEVDHRPRVAGVSKYGPQRIFKVILDLVLILFMSRYYSRPLHFFGQVAFFFVFLLAVVGSLMLVFKYGWLRLLGIDYQASFIQTPLPELGATFLIGAIASIFFGILAEILIRIYHEAQELRPYAVDEVFDSRPASRPCAD